MEKYQRAMPNVRLINIRIKIKHYFPGVNIQVIKDIFYNLQHEIAISIISV